jgi:hypothetical protein
MTAVVVEQVARAGAGAGVASDGGPLVDVGTPIFDQVVRRHRRRQRWFRFLPVAQVLTVLGSVAGLAVMFS